jgi:hypothetical protein
MAERYTTPRQIAWRNLMVAGINAGLDANLFGLGEGENFWPHSERNSYALEFMFGDMIPARVEVHAAGLGELSIAVYLCPTKQADEAGKIVGIGFRISEAYAHGYFERRTSKHLQSPPKPNFSCCDTLLETIAEMKTEPEGFEDHG